jgi:hypothetical protein
MDYKEKSGICQEEGVEIFTLIDYEIHRPRKLRGEMNRMINVGDNPVKVAAPSSVGGVALTATPPAGFLLLLA